MALQTLSDVVKMMKYSIYKVGNQTDHRKDTEKRIIRSVEALRMEVGPQTSNSEGQNISYGLRRLHDIYLAKTDIFSVKEETTILLFNTALNHQNRGIITSDHGSLQNYLYLLKLVLDLLHKKISGKVTFKENQRPSLEKLNLLADTLSIMGEIYSHVGKNKFSEACFAWVSEIAECFILEPPFSTASE